MEIPEGLYGTNREVRLFCQKQLRRMQKGESWITTFGSAPLLNTSEREGLILMSGPSSVASREPQFHPYLPFLMLEKIYMEENNSSPLENQITVFDMARTTPWSLLGLLSNDNVMWVYNKDRYEPMLQSLLELWETLYAEGARYSIGSSQGISLWQIPNNLKYILANLGVDPEILRSPYPTEGLKKLLEQK